MHTTTVLAEAAAFVFSAASPQRTDALASVRHPSIQLLFG